MRILKEPLFHFFLIGAAIFIWFHIVAPDNETVEDLEVITIDENDVALLSSRFINLLLSLLTIKLRPLTSP